MRTGKKFTSFAMGLLLFVLTTVSVYAETPEPAAHIADSYEQQLLQTTLSEYTLDNAPEEMIALAKESSGQTADPIKVSVDEADNLCAVMMENADESKTLLQYEAPIKYVDGDKIKFIDNSLKASDALDATGTRYAYENTANDIKTYFPEEIKSGVSVQYQEHTVTMMPVSDTAVPEEAEAEPNNILDGVRNLFASWAGSDKPKTVTDEHDKEFVEYDDALGEHTCVQYAPVSSGIKENIILEQYTGQNEFRFTVNIGTLIPAWTQGSNIPLLDPETGETAMLLGQVDARDSYAGDDQFKFHTTLDNLLSIVPTETQGEYILTVIIDPDFLTDESTAYPVIIDPTVTVPRSKIQDTSVYSKKTSPDFKTSAYNLVGTKLTSSFYGELGVGNAFMQTSEVSNLKYLIPDKISKVTYNVYEGSGKTSSNIYLYQPNTEWDVGTVTYAQSIGTYHGSVNITTGQTNKIDITDIFKNLVKGQLNEGGNALKCGFAFTGSGTPRHFASAENATYPPSISITYTEDTSLYAGSYFITNKNSNKVMDVQGRSTENRANVHQWEYTGDVNQRWRIISLGGGFYKIIPGRNSSLSLDVDSGKDENGTNIRQYNSNDTAAQQWRIVKNSNGTYRIMPRLGGKRCIDIQSSSKSDGGNVHLWEYLGNPNQQWILEPAYFGFAYSYDEIKTSSTNMNCLGFALQIDKFLDTELGNNVYGSSVETLSKMVLQYVQNKTNKSIRRIPGYPSAPTYSVSGAEYRFAMRVTNTTSDDWDMHFWVQTSDGKWAEKPGGTPSEVIGFGNPSTMSWNTHGINYNSKTIYFAVTR